MRREKAINLVKEWSNKVCTHPEIEKEYFLGRATGNLLCTVCGKTIAKTSNYKVRVKNILKIKFRM
jgi:hypothetical protein